MIGVLIVDDSVVVRRMLSDALTSDPRINVVGTAANGAIALQKLPLLKPDVVILDVEMPDMDGIQTVRALRLTHPRLPVIMCSALTERGAEVTLRALAAGATDYVTKPNAAAAQADGLVAFKHELQSRVISLASPLTQPPPPPPAARITARPRGAIAAIGIGCSTGGPNALRALFARIPRDLPVPIFIVQHMPPVFTRSLAESLSASSGVSVHEAQHGGVVEPGHAYIAPGDYHLVVARSGAKTIMQLNQGPPENSCRPAVDVTFRSLASHYGSTLLACVLTGMGHDGTLGAEKIVGAGGRVLVQSAATCVVASMPSSVLRAGFAEKELPLDELADQLVLRARRADSMRPSPTGLAQGGE